MTETKDKKGDPVKVVSFSVASTKFKRETVNGQEQLVPTGTDWVNCSYWKKDADNLHKSLQSGMPVTVTGTVSRVGVYTSKDTGEILPSIDINCDDVCLRLNNWLRRADVMLNQAIPQILHRLSVPKVSMPER